MSNVTNQILKDAFERIAEELGRTLDGLSQDDLAFRPDPEANSIAWLLWHLTRIQDDHVAGAFGLSQVWIDGGWAERFALPFPPGATGYGQTSEEVGEVRPPPELLADYHQAVLGRTLGILADLPEPELQRVVDERWDPPVTLAVRLVSVVSDDLQHVGQAAYVRGLLERRRPA